MIEKKARKPRRKKNSPEILGNDFSEDVIFREVEVPTEETIIEAEEVEEEHDTLNYNDVEFKKEQLRLIKSDVAITLDNFELLALKYKPVILSNIRNIHKMYMNYPQVEFDDLYQEGLIALYQAIENFDNTRGIFFGVYLKVAIANKLKCFCRNYLPHFYQRDDEKTLKSGKPEFRRILINVGTLDDSKSYLL